jgi:hypothetical protein
VATANEAAPPALTEETPPPLPSAEEPQPEPARPEAERPVRPTTQPAARPVNNSSCLHCHQNLKDELISRVHERRKRQLCIDCHGLSTAHVQAEGEAAPDHVFTRGEIDAYCSKCHRRPHKSQARIDQFIEEWQGKTRPNGRTVTAASVCTDCHGNHVLALHQTTANPPANRESQSAGWIQLFNGRDLAGWEPIGNAKWTVEDGLLIGVQGNNNAPGDLLTKTDYKDFLLNVTYKAEWPANSGVWFRYQSAGQAYQADILEWKEPVAFSGTLYCTGKMFLARNTDRDLEKRDGWNTLVIRAQGDHLQVSLNGHQTADVRDTTSDTGKIGFQVHPGAEFAPMKIIVREIKLQPLGPG